MASQSRGESPSLNEENQRPWWIKEDNAGLYTQYDSEGFRNQNQEVYRVKRPGVLLQYYNDDDEFPFLIPEPNPTYWEDLGTIIPRPPYGQYDSIEGCWDTAVCPDGSLAETYEQRWTVYWNSTHSLWHYFEDDQVVPKQPGLPTPLALNTPLPPSVQPSAKNSPQPSRAPSPTSKRPLTPLSSHSPSRTPTPVMAGSNTTSTSKENKPPEHVGELQCEARSPVSNIAMPAETSRCHFTALPCF